MLAYSHRGKYFFALLPVCETPVAGSETHGALPAGGVAAGGEGAAEGAQSLGTSGRLPATEVDAGHD